MYFLLLLLHSQVSLKRAQKFKTDVREQRVTHYLNQDPTRVPQALFIPPWPFGHHLVLELRRHDPRDGERDDVGDDGDAERVQKNRLHQIQVQKRNKGFWHSRLDEE